jgi:hypothetical protein
MSQGWPASGGELPSETLAMSEVTPLPSLLPPLPSPLLLLLLESSADGEVPCVT